MVIKMSNKEELKYGQTKAEVDAKIIRILNAVEVLYGWRPDRIDKDENGILHLTKGDQWIWIANDTLPNHTDWNTPIYLEK